MNRKSECLPLFLFLLMAGCGGGGEDNTSPAPNEVTSAARFSTAAMPHLTPLETLGMRLFFDANLSTPSGQSCAACHAPEAGWTGPDPRINVAGAVYPGAVHTKFGNRKPPASSYVGESPVLYLDGDTFVGGMFWDGRATGQTTGDPLADQAMGPFLNPVEQHNPGMKQVCLAVARSDYADLFDEIDWEPEPAGAPLDCIKDVEGSYLRIAQAIAVFEASSAVNPFDSKYDRYLQGEVMLTAQEMEGLQLFNGQANCAACHPSAMGPNGEPPLFTDFTYDNLGIPKNPMNPWYAMPPSINPDGEDWIDPGLGGFLAGSSNPEWSALANENYGKHKVPSLRNLDLRPEAGFTKAFGHNGYFKSLEGIVRFYNTRDEKSRCPGDYTEAEALANDCWPASETVVNLNDDELGDLDLSDEQVDALVAFLRTLNDSSVFTPPAEEPRPGKGRTGR